jgi:hypothetical protein
MYLGEIEVCNAILTLLLLVVQQLHSSKVNVYTLY